MKTPPSANKQPTPPNTPRAATGDTPRYWLRITGLPGWRRQQLGVPAFGNANCTRHTATDAPLKKTVPRP